MENRSTTAYAASLVIASNPAKLHRVTLHNSNAAARFMQLHDAASLPADTAVPKVVVSVPASSSYTIDFGEAGRVFSTGIVVCNSTTGPTKTIGAADSWFDAQISQVDGYYGR